jgi:uncharacterized membrane protein
MQKKGAIELSMNTIIVIVIGVTLLILGLTFVTSTFNRISDLGIKSFEVADKTLQDRMGASDKMYIPGTEFKIDPGSSATITVGIQNFGEETTSSKFKVDVTSDVNNTKSWFVLPPELTLEPGDKKSFPLKITLPKGAPPGKSYQFVVTSYKGSERWDEEAIIVSVNDNQ